jgi:hypothetical protein
MPAFIDLTSTNGRPLSVNFDLVLSVHYAGPNHTSLETTNGSLIRVQEHPSTILDRLANLEASKHA